MRAVETPHYSVLAPLDELLPQDDRLPANMKLMPWFKSECTDDEVTDVCADAIGHMEPFTITGGGECHMSTESWRRARIIGERAWLSDIHQGLLDKIDSLMPEFAYPGHIGQNYAPHVSTPDLTKAGSRRWLRRGEAVRIDRLWVVKSYSPNLILRRIGLKEPT